MKKSQIISLTKKLAPGLAGFHPWDASLIRTPLNHVLRGVCIESSASDPKRFYVWVFVQPLFVPCETLVLNLGRRLRSGNRWSVDEPDLIDQLQSAILSEAVEFLAPVNEPADIPRFARDMPGAASDPYILESVAYSYVLTGATSNAIAGLDRLMAVLDLDIPWQRQLQDRARYVRAALDLSNENAQQIIAEWERNNMRTLQLRAVK